MDHLDLWNTLIKITFVIIVIMKEDIVILISLQYVSGILRN